MEASKKKKVIIITIIVLSVLLAVALICLVIVLASGNKTATSTVPDNILSTEDSEDSSTLKLSFDSDTPQNKETLALSEVVPGYSKSLHYTLKFYHLDDITFGFLATSLDAESELAKALTVKVDLLDLDTTTIYYGTLYSMPENLRVELDSEEDTITGVEFRVTVMLSDDAVDRYKDEELDVSLDWWVENPDALTLPDEEIPGMVAAEDDGVPMWLVVVLSVIGGISFVGLVVLIVYLVKKQRAARRVDFD